MMAIETAAYVSKDGLVGHHCKERPIGLANFICSHTGEKKKKKETLKRMKVISFLQQKRL
jgi:hypothetical protein